MINTKKGLINSIGCNRKIIKSSHLFAPLISTPTKGTKINNINEIINKKIKNLPILENDTDNVIEFNDGFSNKIKDQKPRSFWNLLKFE